MKSICCSYMIAALLTASSPCFALEDKAFSELSGKVDKYLHLNERYDKAEPGKWYPQPFKDTKESVADNLNELLDEALKCLVDENLLVLKKEVAKLALNNDRLQEEIANLKLRRLSAPTDKKVYEIWKQDDKDLEDKISRNKRAILENQQKIAGDKKIIQRRLADQGIELTLEEVDNLVNTVTGSDAIQAMIVLRNVQGVLEKVKGLMAGSGESIHIARKYYGLFLLVTQAYDRQLKLFVSRINSKYLPKLAELRDENKNLLAATQAMGGRDERYLNNLKAQRINEEAAKKYEQLLILQKKRLQDRSKEVDRIMAFAENTYKTVNIAHNLYETMNEGLQNYESLMNLPLLEPVYFENKDLQSKFTELTQRLDR